MEHIWSGQKTAAGQKRYDNKGKLFRYYSKPQKSDRILEIGCGDGEFTRRLRGLGGDIIATDLTPAVIERARRKVDYGRLEYRVENCERLSFKSESFTIVCGISILHHVDIKKTLKEAFRVLKPGGRIFFTEPNLFNPLTFIPANIGWLRRRLEYSPGEMPLLRKDVEKILKDIGFRKIVVRNYDFLFPWIPKFIIPVVEKLGRILEKTPVLKEFSGSLLIFASK